VQEGERGWVGSKKTRGRPPGFSRATPTPLNTHTYHLGGHHAQELLEVDGARAVLVNVGDHLLDLLLLGLEAQGTHGHLQLLGIDGA
jgi:hypothetical protein